MDNYKIPIRTIQVKPYNSTMENDIKEYFSQFGEIKSIEMNSENDIKCGFVEFKMADGATAALSNVMHRISNGDVTVEAAEPWHQPDQILNALNDDVLRSIFKYFGLKDLRNAAYVCSQFKKCAEDAFSSNHKTVNLHSGDKDVLINFGPLIRSLYIDLYSYSDGDPFITLKMINEYTCHNLENLSIFGLGRFENLRNLSSFTNLKVIKLERCSISNLNELLTVCPRLEVLQIICCTDIGNCLNQRFEQLKEFHLVERIGQHYGEMINTFIISNPSLTKLAVESIQLVNSVCLIGQHLHELEELELHLAIDDEYIAELENNFQILSNLNSLKALKLKFMYRYRYMSWSVASLLNSFAAKQVLLQEISFSYAKIDDSLIDGMSKLKQLNKICLNDVNGLTNDHVIQLAKELPELRDLTLAGCSGNNINGTTLKNMIRYAVKLSRIEVSEADTIGRINASDYFVMLHAVQNRPDKIQLSIFLTGPGDILNVPEDIIVQNREYLLIDQQIYPRFDVDYDSDSDHNIHYGYDRDFNSSPDSDCYRRWAD